MDLIKCVECGAELPTGTKICPNCGINLKMETAPNNIDNVSVLIKNDMVIPPSEKNDSNKKNDKKPLITIFKNISIVICIITLCIGLFATLEGIDKKNNYYNSENYTSLNENAYVGGDAYNFIINGTYFTAYFTLASGMYVVSAITGIYAMNLSLKINEEKKTSDI